MTDSASAERLPLKRMRITSASVVANPPAVPVHAEAPSVDARPPLPRRAGALPSAGELLPCNGMPLAPERVAASQASRLLVPGVLKFAAPVYSHLGTFARLVVAPIARLFRVVPLSVVRRNEDEQIRVPYIPSDAAEAPLGLAMDVEQFEELRKALGGAVFVGYYYVAMGLGYLTVADKDTDSMRGIAVRQAFCNVAAFINEHLVDGVIAFSVVLYESHHFVCVLRASEGTSVESISSQVCQLANRYFQSQRIIDDMRKTRVVFSVDSDKCGFAQGGGALTASSSSSAPLVKWPILFRPVVTHPEPVVACVQWLLRLKYADQCHAIPLSWIQAVVADWLRSSVKCSISIAGIYLAQLMQWWEADIETCVARICACGSDRDLATLFVYAAGCALQLQCVVISQDGHAEGSFIQTRGYGFLESEKGWCVVAPFNDAECILNELLSHGTISDTLEYISPHAVLDEGDTCLKCVAGGGAGKGKRKRIVTPERRMTGDSECEHDAHSDQGQQQIELFWPPWRHEEDGEDFRALHVTAGLAPPVEIRIPAVWTRDEAERAFASHLALRLEWLDFTWIDADVGIEFSVDFPGTHLATWHQLQAEISALPSSSRRRRNLTMGSETILGHRASRRRGLTSYTTRHEAEVASLVSAVNLTFPGAVYNAIAIVAHGTTPTHRDGTNDPLSDMYVIPCGSGAQSWIWIESTTGCAVLPFELRELSGSWFPLNRAVCFAASLAHKVHSEDSCTSLVLYRTARVPKRVHLNHLAQLGFPLSLTELALMTDDDAVEEDESAGSVDEQATGTSSTDSLLWDHTPLLPPQTERIQMLKFKKDGTLRKISLQLGSGSTVLQAIMIIKKFVKLHPTRLQLAPWNGPTEILPALSADHVVSKEDGPYLIRVTSPGEAGAKGSIRSRTPRPVIGARVVSQPASSSASRPIGAPPQTAHAPASRPIGACHPREPRGRVIGASSANLVRQTVAPSQHTEDQRDSANPGIASGSTDTAANTPFEAWVIGKLSAIEIQQEQLWTEVRSIRAALASSSAHAGAAIAPWRSGGARDRQFVQGGGRFQKVQHDTVARSSQALFSEDLIALDCLLLNEKLVKHMFFSDKKCALAVFQAKSRKQRFFAVSAALSRM
eukprot:3808453-Amphidinium_carterae.1